MKRKILLALLLILLVIALLNLDVQGIAHSIMQISVWTVLLLIGLQIVTQLLVNLQWFSIAKTIGIKISFLDMFNVNSQGAIVDSITPGVKFGGEVTRAMRLSRVCDITNEQSVALVALQKIFSTSVFLVLCLASAFFLLGEMPYLWLVLIGVFVLLAVIGFVVFLLRGRIKSYILTLKGNLAALRSKPKFCVLMLLLGLLIWLIYPVKLLILTSEMISATDILFIASSTFAAYLVALAPIFPGGIGGFEGTMSALLVAVGFALNDALAVTVLFRFFTFWFVLLLSLAFIGVYKVKKKIVP
ncbi:MAG: flippase-like domain-containing protein [Oscillospiraceae bacterium]|nr:flippase-like domain-containing protein [Oscillospiraceae bacterium]MCL2279338.1 flippase-like domain-containing protein [Oscillospiraceae bacterium]